MLVKDKYKDKVKILITGSRSFTDYTQFENYLNSVLNSELCLFREAIVLIHGGARGTDTLASEYCKKYNVPEIIVRPINPSNKLHYLHRNAEMIGMCEVVIAFWFNQSRGTKFTIDYAKARNKKVFIHEGW